MALLTVFLIEVSAQERKGKAECGVATLTFSLNKGDSFQRRISDLTFKIKPMEKEQGWMFFLENTLGRDFIYFVNPPLRFNPAQYLGPSYNLSARKSMDWPRELRFLLSQADYDAMEPIVTNALWPYYAPRPERTVEEYFSALASTRTGLLRLKILKSDVAADDTIGSAVFQVEFIAPTDFAFDPSLKPRHTACPTRTKPY